MKKKCFILIFIGIVVLTGAAFIILKGKNNPPPNGDNNSKIILFYGAGCPHCAVVEEYIKQNKIDEKITFARKEVRQNKDNANELVEKAKVCGLPTDSIGVPFLWDGTNGDKCYVGDKDVIDYFKQKTNGQ